MTQKEAIDTLYKLREALSAASEGVDTLLNAYESKVNRSTRFEEWYKLYPRKVGKPNARKSWERGKLDEQADQLIARLQEELDTHWKGKDIQYIPHPATYLNQERYADPIETNKKITGKPMTREEILKKVSR